MHTYVVINGKRCFTSGLFPCITWAQKELEAQTNVIVKIFKARPSERQMRLIIEITQEGIRYFSRGRTSRMPKRCNDE